MKQDMKIFSFKNLIVLIFLHGRCRLVLRFLEKWGVFSYFLC